MKRQILGQSHVLMIVLSLVLGFSGLGYSATYDVTDYGAVGNGVTDDLAAIHAAIAAADTAGGGTVYFPSGTYLVSNTVDFDATDVNLSGYNATNATIKLNNGTGNRATLFITGIQHGDFFSLCFLHF